MRQTPRENPVKEDSIINLLQNSEIEFKTCPTVSDKLIDMNTGFGENNDLHFKTPCAKPQLKTPLYQENYLSEFVTEEEKAAARHALGLYNKGDIVAMSLLTAKEELPDTSDLLLAPVKQMRQGDIFFTPITSFKAVYDTSGVTLDKRIKEINTSISNQKKDILSITQTSKETSITSLGDVRVFLKGFDNGDNLRNTLDEMNQDMLRFESTGQMNS